MLELDSARIVCCLTLLLSIPVDSVASSNLVAATVIVIDDSIMFNEIHTTVFKYTHCKLLKQYLGTFILYRLYLLQKSADNASVIGSADSQPTICWPAARTAQQHHPAPPL